MYSKDEYRLLKLDFWKQFDNYTLFFSKSVGQPVNWVLYKTGIKNLELKFDVNPGWVAVVIECNARDRARQTDVFNELYKYRQLLGENLHGDWEWTQNYKLPCGKAVGRFWVKSPDISFHNRDNWPQIFSFMATNMYKLQNNFTDIQPLLKQKFASN